MPEQVKPAQFGDVLLQSYEEGTTNQKRCGPSVFLSYYDYGASRRLDSW